MNAAGRYEQGKAVQVNQSYLVRSDDGTSWWVSETGQQWDAWPWPECEALDFDDQTYMQTVLRGKGTATATEKISELIGDPQ